MPNNILRTSPLKSFIKKSPLKADKGLINQFEGAYSKPQKKESTLAKNPGNPTLGLITVLIPAAPDLGLIVAIPTNPRVDGTTSALNVLIPDT